MKKTFYKDHFDTHRYSDMDIYFMCHALREAKKASVHDEVPIGAVVVDSDGKILAKARNKVEKMKSQTGHAELLAIEKACKKKGDWRLNDCTLYVTLEPCIMCMGLITLSRLKVLVFGAHSPLFGYRLDNTMQFQLYKRSLLEIKEGVCAQEATELLQQFFRRKRKEKSE